MSAAHILAADLAARFRLDKRARSWGGDCPACSYPRAFTIKPGHGSRPMLFCANGCTRDTLDAVARDVLGGAWTPPTAPDAGKAQQDRATRQDAARRLWMGSTPCANTPASLYLQRRGIGHVTASAALRYRGDCRHPEGGRWPALVALVQDAARQPIAAHRTFLTLDGRKARVDPVKASIGPVWGGAVRLDPAPLDPAAALVIGEGIETAASAGLLMGLPAWAALSAGNLARGVLLPLDVRHVVIAADHDAGPRQPGQDAAQAAAARWRGEGRTVRIATPDVPGNDFNDLLQDRARRAAEAHHG